MNTKLGLVVLLISATSTAIAGDIKSGRELHQENCISCHQAKMGGDGSGIYTRKDRKVDSYAALKKQVNRCKTSLGFSWPEHQVDDVVTYLNQTYYKFKTDK
jgi:mono/diheme cytochrome c family protein